jgi:hypothetical protein
LVSPTGNSGDQPTMNQPVTFQVNGTFTCAPSTDGSYYCKSYSNMQFRTVRSR